MDKLKQENVEIRSKMFRGLCYFLVGGAAMWAMLCMALGHYVASAVPVAFILFTAVNFTMMRGSSKPHRHVFAQMFMSMTMPMLFQVAMGGLEQSGIVMFWSFVPLVAISGYYRRNSSLVWLAFLIAAMSAMIVYDPGWSGHGFTLHGGNMQRTLLAINIGTVALVIFSAALTFVRVQGRSRRKMHELQGKLECAHALIAERNDHLEKSMVYARRIQQALLPEKTGLEDLFSERFSWIDQKEQVGGDSIWYASKNDVVLMAVVDCTGHGVPASLLSVMVREILTSGFNRSTVTSPAALISFMYQRMEARLKNADGLWNDNAEIAVVEFNRATGTVRFAGTDMSMVVATAGGTERIQGSGPIFTSEQANALASRNHTVKLDPAGTNIYLYSDGVVDQFNGGMEERFGTARLHALMGSISHLPMAEQHQRFKEKLETWKGIGQQTDDLTLMGLRLSPQFLSLAAQASVAAA